MESQKNRLTEAFNTHAGKVVDGRELENLFEKAVTTSLTKQEISDFLAIPQNSGMEEILADDARREALRQKVGDGSLGVYQGRNSVYINSHFLEIMTDFQNVPASISEKVVNAYADAFETAADHRAEVKSGLLRPLPRDMFF